MTFIAVRLTVDLSEVEREKTQEMELRFPGVEGRSLLVLLTITGTSPLQPGCPRREVRPREQCVGSLNITVKRATGLPKLSGIIIFAIAKFYIFLIKCVQQLNWQNHKDTKLSSQYKLTDID